jgi:hypothetical protein
MILCWQAAGVRGSPTVTAMQADRRAAAATAIDGDAPDSNAAAGGGSEDDGDKDANATAFADHMRARTRDKGKQFWGSSGRSASDEDDSAPGQDAGHAKATKVQRPPKSYFQHQALEERMQGTVQQ